MAQVSREDGAQALLELDEVFGMEDQTFNRALERWDGMSPFVQRQIMAAHAIHVSGYPAVELGVCGG